MSSRNWTQRFAAVGLAAIAVIGVSCSSDSDSDSAANDATTTTEASTEETTTTKADDMAMSDMEPFGAACDAVPADGAGSFDGMAQDPAATAASNNPVLSTLVAAVTEAGLVDTLNGAGPFTIFAPTNDAFAKIPEADLKAVLADKEQLTKILTYHVIAGEKMSAEDRAEAGSAATVEGGELTFEGDATSLKVNGTSTTVCGDVSTANATVHIIDTVLMPS